MNCIENECKNMNYDVLRDIYYCILTNKEVPEFDTYDHCDNFIQAKNCVTCVHSRMTVYETGTIDCIEYKCQFQDRIYDDHRPCVPHYSDIPECNCGKWGGIT